MRHRSRTPGGRSWRSAATACSACTRWEIDTAVRHRCGAVFVIANNAAWNIERVDQERNHGGRVSGTLLGDSDYAAMARAFGLHAERVDDPARLRDALARAVANVPALVDVVVTRDTLSSDLEKGLSIVPDYQALSAWDNAERERFRVDTPSR
jgi:acetolactate synthase-1/2/3 large subunit